MRREGTLDQLFDTASALFHSWHRGKMALEAWLPVSHDLLHLFAGLAVWLAAAAVTRRPIASSLPLVALLVVALFNEAVDLWVERWPDPAEQYGESARDLAVTMVVPALLMVLGRLRPQLFRPA